MSKAIAKQVAGAVGLLAAGAVAAVAAQHRPQPDLVRQAARVRERYHQQLAKVTDHPGPEAAGSWAAVGTSAAGALRSQTVGELNELRTQYRRQLGRKWERLSPRDRLYICLQFSPEGVDDLVLED